MSNTEWIERLLPDIPSDVKQAVMEARDVDPAAPYNGSREVELAEADLYMRACLMPEFKEGSLSIKYDLGSLKSQANAIYKRYGDARYEGGLPLIKRAKL